MNELKISGARRKRSIELIRTLVTLTLIVTLAACQTNSYKTQAHYEQERISLQLSTMQAQTKVCADAVKKNELVRKVSSEVIYYGDDSESKNTLVSKRSPPTAEQIELLKSALPHLTKCRAAAIEGTAGTPYQIAVLRLHNALDAIYIRLLKAEITIGDANEDKIRATSQHKIDMATATEQLNDRLNQMYSSEMEGRRQAAAAMMPYLLQKQQSQQVQQQQMYQQQMQSILNSRPIITPSTRTNCTRFENQIDCVTQ